MDDILLDHIAAVLRVNIVKVSRLSGGDIATVFLLETQTDRLVCKLHRGATALRLFQSEKEGLETIAETRTIATPKVIHCEALDKGAFLLMEYIEGKLPDTADMERLGHHLAAMHKNAVSKTFGGTSDNYIGSLPQSNTQHSTWAGFYAMERLQPQLVLAGQHQLLSCDEIPGEDLLLERCSSLLGPVRPALLHGDLWSGNFLISTEGVPYLIDPAAYYGHGEVDIAMTRLFGGFSPAFHRAYREGSPAPANEKQWTDLYQLYYLLVHLNLFGGPYRARVAPLLKQYF